MSCCTAGPNLFSDFYYSLRIEFGTLKNEDTTRIQHSEVILDQFALGGHNGVSGQHARDGVSGQHARKHRKGVTFRFPSHDVEEKLLFLEVCQNDFYCKRLLNLKSQYLTSI